MILLDTNVVSEAMKPSPARAVMDWLREQAMQQLAISAVTVAEIRYGLARLPQGSRRLDLEERFRVFVMRGFSNRVLPFDGATAEVYGDLVARRESLGKPIGAFDAMIAATARVAQARLATRDVGGFEDCGLDLINPWEQGQ